MRFKKFILASCFWIIAGSVLARADDWLNAGFLYDDFPLTLSTGHRTEILGPLFYSEENDLQKTWAFPPLISHLQDSGTDSEEYDFLYPISMYDRFGSEYRWNFLQVLSFAGGENQQEQKARRFTLFPLYFQQRSQNTNQNYTALVPFYGHLKDRLLVKDEIFFIMFPIYSETRKKDVVTDNYLYPIFHLRHGNRLEGWQVWPLIGHEHKEITTKTNGFGDTQLVGGHDNWFALWPIYFNNYSQIGMTNAQHQQAVLPLYSYLRSPQRDSTTVIWPFFTHVTDREKKYREWETPWPMIVFARGEGKTTSRVWPLFSQSHNANLESDFYLWPVYKYNRFHDEGVDRERTRILFFLYSDVRQKNLASGQAQHRMDFWPLFTNRRDYDGSSKLQILSILQPLLPQSKSIERDWSPLWALWRSEKNAKTSATSQSLLWNLYRRDTTPDSKKCSLLFGLFQYQSTPEGKRLRLFYIPVVKTKPAPTPVTK